MNANPRFISKTPQLKHVVVLIFITSVIGGCTPAGKQIKTETGLIYTVLKQGTGPEAKPGQHVTIHENVSFTDGRLFFSTREGKPVRFLLGGKQAIDGLDEGVTGMRAGEVRKLIVPPSLSQRTSYPDSLPPDATLIYEVELIAID